MPTLQKYGKVHLGLGCYIASENPRRDIRTITNANSQFWSIITLLAVNKMHQLIDKAGYQNDIKCISTIYDSIYYTVTENLEIIQWLNNNLISAMTKDFLVNQTVPNEACSEIGYNWADLVEIPNNCSVDTISDTLRKLNEN